MREQLPATYLHVLAFPLHMALMTDSGFPFGAIGLVHISNRITQHRPVRVEEKIDLSVRATPLEKHPRGQTSRSSPKPASARSSCGMSRARCSGAAAPRRRRCGDPRRQGRDI